MTGNVESGVLDLLIIGAGVYGICAASTYLALHPESKLIVLDEDEDVGGVWSRSRHYPLFWSQSGVRVSGFPDVPFRPPADAERFYDLPEARSLGQYLHDYVDMKVYDGQSLRERFAFRATVKDVRKAEDGLWRVTAEQDSTELRYMATKVIVATGLTSLPNMPNLPGRETFQGLVVHQKDIGRSRILTPEEPDIEKHEHVTIYGGGKSAADLAYAAATDTLRHRKVTWVIRSSGSGPLSVSHPKPPVPGYRNVTELACTRAIAALSSANPYLPESSWREWLWNSAVGEWLLNKIWTSTETKVVSAADFVGREGKLPGFEGLQPTGSARWLTSPIGLLQRDDWWDVIARKVQVCRGEIARLEPDHLVLNDGRVVSTDVLICATGWKQEFPFFSAKEAARLGLPIPLNETKLVDDERQLWRAEDSEAEKRVLARWPYLAQVLKVKANEVRATPYRLYRYTIPLHDHSIAFLGTAAVPNAYHTAVVQSLLAIAHLDGNLKLPTEAEMADDIAFVNAWSRIRYPLIGHPGNVLNFEMLSFTDIVLDQLGLSSHRLPAETRKRWTGWWQDLTQPSLAADYAGLIDEYRKKYHQSGTRAS
ncbi:hypothetical protein BAUCODRAFT_126990 [Baudoinia panamericana UAMH 10762]|uniref:FAD/NAD(P)-binding domain-containing protein n=1 Tax=Baudoinia panamericana (strain UAMH 10762) TaxID=717646 RepID=M2MIH0_BAUPA|nr:uncharacterized protein BAUCODRAFT_126990 [Baudoinia panamericana UAMH 10762]EMC91068.1 hypothetical protein BAUCODRAFT_126990 [Baudoinia panamericana UAMH 10762]